MGCSMRQGGNHMLIIDDGKATQFRYHVRWLGRHMVIDNG